MNFKKILAMVLVVAMCFSMIPTYALADGGEGHEHNYDAVVTEPTCEEQGYTTYTCTECGDRYVDDYTDALGHDYQVFETVDPTCDAEGYTVYKCSRCGATENSNFVAAKGHDFVDGVCTVCDEADPDYVAPVLRSSVRGFVKVAAVDFVDGEVPDGWSAEFSSLTDAVNHAGSFDEYTDNDGDPEPYVGHLDNLVTMTKAATLGAVTLERDVTLDINGKKLTLSGFSITDNDGNPDVAVKLIITGTGTIEGDPTGLTFADGYYYENGQVVAGYRYTVSFYPGYGVNELMSAQTVNQGLRADKPEDPTRTGYTFAGWKDEAGYDWDFSAGVYENKTLTAQWTAHTYTVVFAGDGNLPAEKTATYDEALAFDAPSLDNYVFEGWTHGEATYPVEGLTVAQVNALYPGKNGTVTLTANWAAAEAKIGDVFYKTLAEAFAAAQDFDTVTLVDNLTLTSTVTISRSVTLNLNGFELTGNIVDTPKADRLHVTVDSGEVTIENGTINARINAYDDAKLTLAEDLRINGTIVVWGDGTYGETGCKTPTLNIYAKISNPDGFAVCTNGSDKSSAVINVYPGAALSSTNETAFYLPSGNLSVYGGTITGATGIFVRGGNLSIPATYEGQPNAAVITGTGEDLEPAFAESGDGCTPTGDAVTIVSSGYPNEPTAAIAGGSFVTTEADAVGSYALEGQTPLTGFVSGGVFNTPVADAYCADNFMPSGDNGNYGVQPCYVVTFDLNGGTIGDSEDDVKIKVPATDSETVTAPAAPVKAADGVTTFAFTGWKNGDDVVDAGELTTAITGNVTYTAQFDETENVAKIGDNYYTTLAAAAAAVTDGQTIVMIAETTENEEVIFDHSGAAFTLDLAGFEVEVAKDMWVKNGSLTLTSSKAGGKVTDTQNDAAIYVSSNSNNASATLNLNSDNVTVTGGQWGIAFMSNATVNISAGTVTASYGEGYAISGNGNSTGAVVNLSGGQITGSVLGVYFPGSNELNISGDAVISGATGVYVKSGTTTITGGTITGTGDAEAYSYYGNGGNPTGDALVVDNCNYPSGAPAVTISGGVFTSANGKAVGSYSDKGSGDTDPGLASVNAHVNTLPVLDNETWVPNSTTGGYDLVAAVTVTFDANGGTPVPAVQKIQKGTKATEPTAPTKADGVFQGWYLVTDATTTPVTVEDDAFDFDTEIAENITLQAKWTTAVASVDGVNYDNFADAYAAASDVKPLKLLADHSSAITIDKALTLDLNGYTISASSDTLKIMAEGVVVTDTSEHANGSVKATGYSKYAVNVQSGSAEINAGSIEGNRGLNVSKGASATVTGTAIVKGTQYGIWLAGDYSNPANTAVITVSGTASVSATNSDGVGIRAQNASEITVGSGTSVYGTKEGIRCGLSKLTVADGTVTCGTGGTDIYYAAVTGDWYSEYYSNILKVVEDNGKITLYDDQSGSQINNGKTFTVDLNNHKITTAFNVKSGFVTFENGTITGTISVYGSSDSTFEPGEYNKLVIAEDVEMTNGKYSIVLYNHNYSGEGVSYGSLIDVNGKTTNIWVIGTLHGGNCTININNGAVVADGDGVGIGLNGAAVVNVKEDASVSGSTTGIEVRAGVLNVTGGTITGGSGETTVTQNASGTTTKNAGIAIAQHVTQLPISVNVSGGTITGTTALNISNPQGNSDAEGDEIVVRISGMPVFNGETNTADDAFDERAKIIVSGGSYGTPVRPEDCATGYYPVDNNDGTYGVSNTGIVAYNVTKGVAYSTLAAAIDAASASDTITLLADIVTVDAMVTLEKNLIIDLNGKTLMRENDTAHTQSVFQVVSEATLTINGAAATGENAHGAGTFYGRLNAGKAGNDNGSITLNGGKYECGSNQTVLHVNGECLASNITIDGATITSADDNGIQLNGAGTHSITNSTISGKTAVYVKAGTVSITGSTLTSTAASHTAYNFNGNGSNPTGDAIVVDSCAYPGGNPTVTLGAGNTITVQDGGENVQVGYYEANTDKEGYQSGVVTATSADNSIPNGYCWQPQTGGGYKLAKAVAKIGNVGYATLAEAIAAVPTDGTQTTITMIADEDVAVSGYALTIPAGKNVVLDLNGHQVVGQCTTSGTSALIRNLGTLTINDSSDPSTGKLIGGADPTWTWDGSDDYSASYASNLIRNEGTLVVNGGTLYNASSGSAAYAIDNYGAGKVTINGGKIDAKKASAIRLFYNNGGSVTVNDGAIGRYNGNNDRSYMGIQVMSGTNADVEIKGGTVDGYYSVYSNGTGDSSVNISNGTFPNEVSFGSAGPDNISISGGTFESWVGAYGDQTGFISGGTFVGEAPDKKYIAPNKAATLFDEETQTYVIADAVAQVTHDGVTTGYLTLAAAIDAAQSDDTVTVLDDITLTAPVEIRKNITLDLAGWNVTRDGNCLLDVYADVTLKDSGRILDGKTDAVYGKLESTIPVWVNNGGKFRLESGAINGVTTLSGDKPHGIYVEGGEAVLKGGTVTSEKWGVSVWNTATVTVYDGATVIGINDAAIATNGNAGQGATVNVTGGTITSQNDIAVYVPSGTLNVSGGTITGKTAVYFKSTNLNITGGSLIANGNAAEYSYYGNGANATGDALVIDNCGYPNGISSISVKGGYFESANAQPIASYANGQEGGVERTPKTKFVSAVLNEQGEITSAPSFNKQLALNLCADGFVPSGANAQGKYTVELGTPVVIVSTPDGDSKYFSVEDTAVPAQVGAVLVAAVGAAADGDTVTLLADASLTASLTINKGITFDGGDNELTATITSSNPYVIEIPTSEAVVIKNVTINTSGRGIHVGVYSNGAAQGTANVTVNNAVIQMTGIPDYNSTYTSWGNNNNYTMGIAAHVTGGSITVKDTTIQGFSYCVNPFAATSNLTYTMSGGALKGRAALNVWSTNSTFNLSGVTIVGINNEAGPTESFACIVNNSGASGNSYKFSNVTATASIGSSVPATSSATEYFFRLAGEDAVVEIKDNTSYTINAPARGGLEEYIENGWVAGFEGKIYMDETAYANLKYLIDGNEAYTARGTTSSEPLDWTIGQADVVAAVLNAAGTTLYGFYYTVQEAIDDVGDDAGRMVALWDDVTEAVTIGPNQNLVFDLNDRTLSGRVKVNGGTVVIQDAGKIKGRLDSYDGATVTLADDAIVDGVVVVWGDGTYGETGCKTPTLNVYGKVIRSADVFEGLPGLVGDEATYDLVTTNGTDESKPVINVYNGAEINGGNDIIGIYLPSGELNVAGGEITGTTAVYAKSGSVSISGGTLNATGDATAYSYNGNGANATGDALVVDSCNYPGGKPTVEISGGTFTVTDPDAKQIGYYEALGSGTELTSGVVTATSADNSIPDGYCWQPQGTTPEIYKLAKAVATVTIGSETTQYASLAEAFTAANAATGTATITMVADENIAVNGSALTVAKNQNIVLDLNGHSVVGYSDVATSTALIKNNGTLTITDSSDTSKNGTGAGKLISGATTTWIYDGSDNFAGSYASNLIDNTGTLTVESGYLENISTGSACYAIDNNSSGANAITTITGGQVKGHSVAIRQFCNSTTLDNTVNISGGTVSGGYSGLWIQLPNIDATKAPKAALNVTGGTISGGSYAFYDYSYGNSYTDVHYDIDDGAFVGSVYSYGAEMNISNGSFAGSVTNKGETIISGGSFDGYVYAPDGSIGTDISGGTFNGAFYAYASENTISGGTFNGAVYISNDKEISGGTFEGNINSYGEGGFITGGKFKTQPEEVKIDPTMAAYYDDDGYYHIGDAAAKVNHNGVETGYLTLEAAFAAAVNGDTVELLKTSFGSGIIVPQDKFPGTEDAPGLTVDFGGFTYTVDSEPLAGSTGTKTQAFQLLKGNKITFKNGTIYSEKAKMLVQNYSDLTLDKMTLTLNNQSYTSPAYTLSNNNGSATIKDTTINANNASSFAFDVCRYSSYPSVHVTVTGSSVINGDVELSASGSDPKNGFSLTLTSGTHNGNIVMDATAAAAMATNPAETVTKASTFTEAAPAGYMWVDGETAGTQVLAKAVAKINDTSYASLEAAWNAAQDGDKITLLADSAGNGLKAPQGKFGTKGLTVDFNGHTYTVDGNTVGSTGTETNGFQLLKDNTITFKDGTITSTKAKILIQNYSDLTLDNMTLTLDNPDYDSAYTLSNNNGDVEIYDTTINANPAGGFAFDVCRYASYPSVHVIVTGDSEINGNVELSASGSDAKDGMSLTLTSGTLTGSIVLDDTAKAAMAATPDEASVTEKDTFHAAAPEGYFWKSNGNGTSSLKKVVAKIGTTNYASLADAFAAVSDGTATTIEVMADSTGSGIIVPSGRNITVNFNNHSYTVDSTPLAGSTGTQTQGFQLLKDSTIVFNNGTILADNPDVKMIIQNYANLTLNGMTLNATADDTTNSVSYVLSTNNGSTTINNTKITAKDSTVAFDACTGWGGYTGNSVEVTGSSVITGNIEVSFYGTGDAGEPKLTLTGGTLNGNIVVGEKGFDNATVTKATDFTANAPAGYKWENDGTKDVLVKESFEVTTTSSGNGGIDGSSVATVSGGGRYVFGATATVKAPMVSGYTFKGWYDKTNTKLSGLQTYDYIVRAQNNDLIAVYEPASASSTFRLTVTGSKFKFGDEGTIQRSRFDDNYTANTEIKLIFVGDENEEFLYWVNGANKIESTTPEFTFDLVKNTQLHAVTNDKSGTSTDKRALVAFVSATYNGQVISQRYYKYGEPIVFPAATASMGKVFAGWSKSEDEIQQAIYDGATRVVVTPIYTNAGAKYTVTVNYVDVDAPQTVIYSFTTEEKPVGQAQYVNADETYNNTWNFMYWSDKASGGTILSYNTAYSVRPSEETTTLYAVYTQSEEPVEKLPTVVVTNQFASTSGTSNIVNFAVTRSVPEGYILERAGILYAGVDKVGTETDSVKTLLSLEGMTSVVIDKPFTAANTDDTGTLFFSTSKTDRQFIARGYIIVKKGDVVTNIYSDNALYASFNELNNGIGYTQITGLNAVTESENA